MAERGRRDAHPGYEEIVVDALPYGEQRAVRAREHTRLAADADPSERCKRLLVEGARSLGLEREYVAALEARTTQRVGGVLRALTVQHLFFQVLLFRAPRMRPLARAISALLWHAYVPTSHPTAARRFTGNAAPSLLLLPTATLGVMVRLVMFFLRVPTPPMMKAVLTPPKQQS